MRAAPRGSTSAPARSRQWGHQAPRRRGGEQRLRRAEPLTVKAQRPLVSCTGRRAGRRSRRQGHVAQAEGDGVRRERRHAAPAAPASPLAGWRRARREAMARPRAHRREREGVDGGGAPVAQAAQDEFPAGAVTDVGQSDLHAPTPRPSADSSSDHRPRASQPRSRPLATSPTSPSLPTQGEGGTGRRAAERGHRSGVALLLERRRATRRTAGGHAPTKSWVVAGGASDSPGSTGTRTRPSGPTGVYGPRRHRRRAGWGLHRRHAPASGRGQQREALEAAVERSADFVLGMIERDKGMAIGPSAATTCAAGIRRALEFFLTVEVGPSSSRAARSRLIKELIRPRGEPDRHGGWNANDRAVSPS